MKKLILVAGTALLIAGCGEDVDTDTAIDTTPDAPEGYDPPDAGEAPVMNSSETNSSSGTTPVSGDFPEEQVGDTADDGMKAGTTSN